MQEGDLNAPAYPDGLGECEADTVQRFECS